MAAALAALPWVRSGAEVAGHRLKLQGISQALERGESVELIPETGPPASFLVRAGKSFTGVGTRPEEAFQVWAFGHALIELHNDPHTERYRFSAEIREERALPDAEVGLYYSYQRPAVVGGKGHFFGYVSFADLGRSAQQARDDQGRAGSRAFHNHCYYLEPGPQPIRWAAFNNSSRWYRPPEVEMNQPGPWRHLAVEVTPELVSVTFDDLEFDPFPQFRVQRWATDLPKLQPSLQGSPVPIGPRGGLGLYVYGCTASFRRCRLEPLGSPEPLSTR